MRIALYQPDIAQNVGAILRTAACFDLDVEIIEPCGFPFDDRKFRRAAMDYIDTVNYTRHNSFDHFLSWKANQRLLLFSTKGTTSYTDFTYRPNDILLFGRESAGVPESVATAADHILTIPIKSTARSLNLATSVAIASSEAIRQNNIA